MGPVGVFIGLFGHVGGRSGDYPTGRIILEIPIHSVDK